MIENIEERITRNFKIGFAKLSIVLEKIYTLPSLVGPATRVELNHSLILYHD